jgi:hypothetical protein
MSNRGLHAIMLPAVLLRGHYLAGNCETSLPRAMLVADTRFQRSGTMTPNRVLQLNALFTAAGAAGMLATRGLLYPQFGLAAPLVLDVLALGLLAYAIALVIAARQQPVDRPTLLAFTAADALWVGGSAVVLMIFWSQFTPLARTLVIAVALAVDVFATLQYRAAGTARARALGSGMI